MTIDAKLRVSADLKDARAQVQGLEQDLRNMRKAGTDKTDRAGFEDLRAKLRLAKEATRDLAQAQEAQAKAANKATLQNVQLSAQLQDFFVQVQAGGSPLTALIQQGSQLSFVYGGAGNAFKAVTSLLTPLRLALGATAAGIGLLAAAYLGGEKQSNEFAKSLVLTGGFAGITAGQFEDMAQRVSRSVDSSIGGAKETIQGLVSTGKFTSTALEPVAIAIEKVSALTGQTRDDVIKDFTAMADGGLVKFAEKLNSSYNFLDLATYKYIKRLQEQGRESEAQVLLVTKLNQSLGDTTKNLGTLERAWNSIAKAASKAWDAFLGVGRKETVEERVASAAAALAQAQDNLAINPEFGGSAVNDVIDAQNRLDTALESKRLAERAAQRIASEKETNKKQIAEEIKKDKEAGKNQLTRLAQTKQFYDRELELGDDANKRELKSLQDKYNDGLLTLQEYLGRKRALQEQDAALDIARLEARLKAERDTLATNVLREAEAKKRGDKNGLEQAQETNLQSRQKIEQLETQLVIRKRDQADAAAALLTEEKKITDEITKQFAAFEVERRKANGDLSTPEQATAQAKARYQALYDKLGILGDTGGQAIIDRQVEKDARKIQFDELAAQLEQRSASLKAREDALRQANDVVGISAAQTEREIIALRDQEIDKVGELTQALESLADSNPDKARVITAKKNLAELQDTRTTTQKSLDANLSQGFSTMFTEIIDGSKSAGDALRDMLRSFASSVLDLIARQLGNQLLQSLFPTSAGGVAGGGGFLQTVLSLFGLHRGGVVRPGGQTFTRQIPMGLAAAAAQYAPRYHTGGIAGFKPNERLAVLEQGEEVLTEDNPRHINNMRTSGGVSVSNQFVISGASGDDAKKKTALDDLAGQMEALIDQWSLKQQRPGGILFKGAR